MSHIFLSYASEDRDRIMPVVRALEATGWSVFWDRTIPVGDTWQKIIGAEIEACHCMIVVWSAASINKEWVYEEAMEGKRRGVLAPVMIDDITPPIGFRSIQAAKLEAWDGKSVSAEYDRLIKDISRMLDTSSMKIEEQKEEKRHQEAEASRRALTKASPAKEPGSKRNVERTRGGAEANESEEGTGGNERRRGEGVSSRGAPDVAQIVGHELRTLRSHKGYISGLAASGDGRLAVSAFADDTVEVWDVTTGRKLRTLEDYGALVAVSGDGRSAVSVSVSYDTPLKVWDVKTGRELYNLEGHTDLVFKVAVSGDGRLALSTSADDTVKLWDMETGRELRTLRGRYQAALSGDGRFVVTGSADGTLKVWDVGTGRKLRALGGGTSPVVNVAVNGNGQRAFSAFTNGTLKVWDVETGRELQDLEGYTEAFGLAVSGDGQLVSACEDNTLKVWHAETGVLVVTFTFYAKASCCAFIGDDQLAAADEDGYLHFLRLEKPEC